jgi:putative flippase GtrA
MFRNRLASFAALHSDFISFATVGLVTGVIYFLCISVLLELFNADYRIAVTTAYAAALTVHFFANRNLTFGAGGEHAHGRLPLQLVRYAGMVAINYVTTLGIVIGAVTLLARSPYFGALAAIGVNLFLNYFISKYWIFNRE